jgi:hypothetical protein
MNWEISEVRHVNGTTLLGVTVFDGSGNRPLAVVVAADASDADVVAAIEAKAQAESEASEARALPHPHDRLLGLKGELREPERG